MTMQTIIRSCAICGAVIFIEITVDGHTGIPSGEPDKHAEWHERNNQ